MQVDLGIAGITARVKENVCIVTSQAPLTTLSSTIVGGGLGQTRCLLNASVGMGYQGTNPVGDLLGIAAVYGLTPPFVGTCTAVAMHHLRCVTLRQGGITVSALITAGIDNAIAAGLSPPASPSPGTINTMLFIDAALVSGALINLVTTATEAKTAVLHAMGIRLPTGEPATGTSTDALVIACTERGPQWEYGGPITPVVALVAQAVRRCLPEALAHA